MVFTDKLNLLIKAHGYSRKKFSEAIHIPYSTIDNWYKRSYENLSVSTLKTLCSFFGVTMESMAYDDREIAYVKDVNDDRPADESVLLRGYRAAGEETRGTLLLIARQAISQAGERVETFAPSDDRRESAG